MASSRSFSHVKSTPLVFCFLLVSLTIATGAWGAGPDLVPFAPDGWPDKIIVSDVPETRADGTLYSNQTVYVDMAVINQGTAGTGAAFAVELWDDTTGQKLAEWSSGALGSYYYTWIEDVPVVFTQDGWHTIRIKVDAKNSVSPESNESNNSYTRQVLVHFQEAQADILPVAPQQWDGPIVVANQPDTTTHSSVKADAIGFIDYCVGNLGSADAGVFGVELWDLTENKLIARDFFNGLASGYLTGAPDAPWMFDTPGEHVLLLAGDFENNIPNEANEVNNEYVYRVQVAQPTPSTMVQETVIPHDYPIYLQKEYRNEDEGSEGSGICMATALAGILAYWDRNEDPEGTHYWNLITNGRAPLVDQFPGSNGHDQGYVYETIRELVWYYYHQRMSFRETMNNFCARRGLSFQTQTYFQQSKANLWQHLTRELDAGRPAILSTSRVWTYYYDHALPVYGYRITGQGTQRRYFIKVGINGVLTHAVVWAGWNGGDRLNLNVDGLYTLKPDGTPSDIYEFGQGHSDNERAYANWIEPNDLYGFRQTHNFDNTPGSFTGDTADWVKFKAEAGKTYTIETENLGIDCDSVLELQAGTTNLYDRNSGDEYNAARIVWRCTKNTTAYIKVTERYQFMTPHTNYDLCVTSTSAYASGRGTLYQPYRISSARHLAQLWSTPEDWDNCFRLDADLNLKAYAPVTFQQIGTDEQPFNGSFDFNGHTIRNINHLTGQNSKTSIFGTTTSEATILE